MARMLPGEAELVSEWTCLSGRATSVKRFERSNGLDTALYKTYLYPFILETYAENLTSSVNIFDVIPVFKNTTMSNTKWLEKFIDSKQMCSVIANMDLDLHQ